MDSAVTYDTCKDSNFASSISMVLREYFKLYIEYVFERNECLTMQFLLLENKIIMKLRLNDSSVVKIF